MRASCCPPSSLEELLEVAGNVFCGWKVLDACVLAATDAEVRELAGKTLNLDEMCFWLQPERRTFARRYKNPGSAAVRSPVRKGTRGKSKLFPLGVDKRSHPISSLTASGKMPDAN